MAGGYPDTPQQRLAYDLMGTQLFWDGTLQALSVQQNLNRSYGGNFIVNADFGDDQWLTWLFQAPIDLYGHYAAGFRSGTQPLTLSFFHTTEYSLDVHTINGGTWTGIGQNFGQNRVLWDDWRRNVKTFTATAAWGYRGLFDGASLSNNTHLNYVHLYGSLNDAHTPNRLILIDDDTGLEFDNVLDWGYTPRGVVKSHVAQVKNNSTTHQADSVTINHDSLHSSPKTWHDLRDGVGAWSTSLSLGNIAADTTYANDITVRVTIPSTAFMGPWDNRIKMDVTGWT